MSDTLEPMLTVAQVAAELGVNKATVYRWISAGKLRGVRCGPKVFRIKREDLADVLEPTRDERLPSQADWNARQREALDTLRRVKLGLPLS